MKFCAFPRHNEDYMDSEMYIKIVSLTHKYEDRIICGGFVINKKIGEVLGNIY